MVNIISVANLASYMTSKHCTKSVDLRGKKYQKTARTCGANLYFYLTLLEYFNQREMLYSKQLTDLANIASSLTL